MAPARRSFCDLASGGLCAWLARPHTWADRLRALLAPNSRVGVESICPLQVYEALPGTRVQTDIIDEARLIESAYDAPFLADGYDRVIEPGMFLTIDPGVYLPGIGGFRHSDTAMTTDHGNVALTDGPVTLDELTLPLSG